jgi:hypothetical protein
MLLQELLGVKRFHKMTKTEMLLFINRAFKAGDTKLEWVGRGAAGTVLTDGTDIYKFWLKDDGYDAYIEYVHKNQGNPYLPKLKSAPKSMPTFHKRTSDVPDRVRWVKMERLTDNHDEIRVRFDKIRVEFVACANYFIAMGDVIDTKGDAMREVEHLLGKQTIMTGEGEANPELLLFIKTACDIGKIIKRNHLKNDLQVFNVMKRGGFPVIVDPMASEDDHKFNAYLDKVEQAVGIGEVPAISGPSKKNTS